MDEIKKRYYSIGEVAELLQVPASVIRFWEKEFTHIQPRKNKKGNRTYTQKELDALKEIHYLLRVKKYTIKGAKEIIALGDPILVSEIIENEHTEQTYDLLIKHNKDNEFKDFLEQTRNFLVELKNKL